MATYPVNGSNVDTWDEALKTYIDTRDDGEAATHDYGSGTTAWSMTASEAAARLFTVTGAGEAADAVFPAVAPGKIFVVYNNSGYAITFKVTGQTGFAVANGKYAICVHNASDCVKIYEQP